MTVFVLPLVAKLGFLKILESRRRVEFFYLIIGFLPLLLKAIYSSNPSCFAAESPRI